MVVIGMDLPVCNSYLHVADEHGRRLKRGRIGNTLHELAAFLGPFEGEAMTVSLESTTNSRSMHRLLEHYGQQAGVDLTARVLDARKLRIIAESVNKTDKVDAQVLAGLTRSGLHLPKCYVPDDEVFCLARASARPGGPGADAHDAEEPGLRIASSPGHSVAQT